MKFVNGYMRYREEFPLVDPKITNIFPFFYGNRDDGNELHIRMFPQEEQTSRHGNVLTIRNEHKEAVGWSENINITWLVYQDWSPICSYHNNEFCASINRFPCSMSFYDESCQFCLPHSNEYNQWAKARIYGARQCLQELPDQIVLSSRQAVDIGKQSTFENVATIKEGESENVEFTRKSYYNTQFPLGYGRANVLYTIQNWETDPLDFGTFSGEFDWKDGDSYPKFDELKALKDERFDLQEKFYIVAMLNDTTDNITLQGATEYDNRVTYIPS